MLPVPHTCAGWMTTPLFPEYINLLEQRFSVEFENLKFVGTLNLYGYTRTGFILFWRIFIKERINSFIVLFFAQHRG